jgi:hypothetical protein
MTEPTMTAPVFDGDRAPFAKAFVAAQKATESVKKAASNPAFRSKYADLSEVVEAVVPALNNAGIAVIQSPAFDGELVGLTTILLHETGASCTATLHLRPSKLDPQGVGSAITYARRYALLAMTGAAPEDDDGNAASGPRQEPAKAPQPAPKAPTLRERAERLMGTIREVETAPSLDKALNLAAGLMAELDAKDPDLFAEVETLRKQREAALAERVPA